MRHAGHFDAENIIAGGCFRLPIFRHVCSPRYNKARFLALDDISNEYLLLGTSTTFDDNRDDDTVFAIYSCVLLRFHSIPAITARQFPP